MPDNSRVIFPSDPWLETELVNWIDTRNPAAGLKHVLEGILRLVRTQTSTRMRLILAVGMRLIGQRYPQVPAQE